MICTKNTVEKAIDGGWVADLPQSQETQNHVCSLLVEFQGTPTPDGQALMLLPAQGLWPYVIQTEPENKRPSPAL